MDDPSKKYLFTIGWFLMVSFTEALLMVSNFFAPYQLALIYLFGAVPILLQFWVSLPVFILHILLGFSVFLNTLVAVPGLFTNLTFSILAVLLLSITAFMEKPTLIVDILKDRISRSFLFFLFFALLSLLVNPSHFTFKDNLFAILLYACCFLAYYIPFNLLAGASREARCRIVGVAFFELAIIAAFLALHVLILFISSGMPAMKGSDVRTIFGSGGPMGCFFMLSFSMLFGVYTNLKDPKLKIFVISAIAIVLSGLFLTFSRAAILGALASLLAILYFKNMRAFLLILIGSLAAFFLFVPLQEFVLDLYTARKITYTLNRIDIWADAFSIFNRNFFLGIGSGNYSYFSNFSLRGFIVQSPHNNYLQIMTETGIFGFSAFAIMIYLSVRTIVDSYKKIDEPILKGASLGFLGALVGVLVANFFGDFLLPAKENLGHLAFGFIVYYWVLLGFFAALGVKGGEAYETAR